LSVTGAQAADISIGGNLETNFIWWPCKNTDKN
jgi:hypothetical protein